MKLYELLFLLNKKKLQDFKLIEDKKIIPFINSAYKRIIENILYEHNLNTIITKNDIDKLSISKNMKIKLLDLISRKITKDDLIKIKKKYIHDQLIQIAGIGNDKANNLIKLGLNNISQLKLKKWSKYLTDSTIIWLNHKPNQKIPRNLITLMKPKLIDEFVKNYKYNNIDKSFKIQIVGGYLRKRKYSRDIDIMIISDKLILSDYINYLKNKYITVVYSKGSDKASLIIKGIKGHYYKIDIFITLPKYQYAMLFYSTGSRDFNIKMRRLAKKMGFLLNQKGLYKLNGKINSKPIKINSEKQIFEKLGIKYIPPENR
jgi:DNA polymerase/3'-5' exonuclease PolX